MRQMSNTIRRDPVALHEFSHQCDGMIAAIKIGARQNLRGCWDGTYLPYYGDVVNIAVWHARLVYRQAKKLGLLDQEDQLRVLVRLDVEAGELVE